MTKRTFKDFLLQDVDNVFLNTNEFGDIHKIDGVEMPVIVDGDGLEDFTARSAEMNNAMEGIYQRIITIYVKATDYEMPVVGKRLKLDDDHYSVTNVSDSAGILKINLVSNES